MERLNLPTKTMRSLRSAGVLDCDDLRRRSTRELSLMPRIGAKTLEKIVEALEQEATIRSHPSAQVGSGVQASSPGDRRKNVDLDSVLNGESTDPLLISISRRVWATNVQF
jgi:hypothetical protein